jgi:hypothetical protein
MPASSTVEESAVQEFEAGLRGGLLRPEEGGYDAARHVFNGMIDKRPAWIVRCLGASDAMRGVNFARTHDLLLDLSLMKGIRVDPARRVARAEAGLILGDFDRETQAFGLATPLGVVSMTGIAGLTLGGSTARPTSSGSTRT